MASHIIVKALVDGVEDINGTKYPKGVEVMATESYYIRKLARLGEIKVVVPKKSKATKPASKDAKKDEQK